MTTTTHTTILLAIILTPLTIWGVSELTYKARRKYDRREVKDRLQQMAPQAMDELDNPSSSATPPSGKVSKHPGAIQLRRRQRHRYASRLAAECKLHINGVESKTAANDAVIAHFINKRMLADNVRLCDTEAIRLAATLFIHTPTAEAVFYKQLSNTTAFIDRETAGHREYWTTRSIWDWFTLKFKTQGDPITKA